MKSSMDSLNKIPLRAWIVLSLVISVEAYLIATSASYILVGFFALLIIFAFSHETKIALSFIFFILGTLLISLLGFRLGGSVFNASDFFYLLSALFLCVHLVATGNSLEKIFLKDNPLLIPLVIFLFGAVLSMMNSADPRDGLIVIGKYAFLFGVWLPVGIYLFSSIRKVKWLLLSLIIGLLFPMIIAISDYFFNTNFTLFFKSLLGLKLDDSLLLNSRFGTVVGHPNNFGLLLTVVFPFCFAIVLLAKRVIGRILGLLLSMGALICCAITGSRSAMLSILVEVIILPCFIMSRRKVFAAVISGVLFICILSGFKIMSKISPHTPLARFSEMMNYEAGKYKPDMSRIISMKKAWSYIKDNPITGIGAENLNPTVRNKRLAVHNAMFRIWASVGIFGFVSLFWFYGKPIVTAFYLLKITQDVEMRNLIAIISSSMFGWMLFDMWQPQFHNRMKWIVVIALFAII